MACLSAKTWVILGVVLTIALLLTAILVPMGGYADTWEPDGNAVAGATQRTQELVEEGAKGTVKGICYTLVAGGLVTGAVTGIYAWKSKRVNVSKLTAGFGMFLLLAAVCFAFGSTATDSGSIRTMAFMVWGVFSVTALLSTYNLTTNTRLGEKDTPVTIGEVKLDGATIDEGAVEGANGAKLYTVRGNDQETGKRMKYVVTLDQIKSQNDITTGLPVENGRRRLVVLEKMLQTISDSKA